jgi:anaerobic magnesium-protoporphyrin IX monomethyl ester cyclase
MFKQFITTNDSVDYKPAKVFLTIPMERRLHKGVIIPVYPDVGLGYVGSACNAARADVTLLSWNQNLSIRELRESIANVSPDLAGVKVFTLFLKEAKSTLQAIRAAAPEAIIVIGGPHTSTSRPEDLFAEFDGLFDFAVAGDGESAMAGLVHQIAAKGGQSVLHDPKPLPGLIYERDGTIKHTPPDLTMPLDELPAMDWSLQNPNWFQSCDGASKWFAPVMDSRGCPAHCGFCECSVINGSSPRYRAVDDVCDEIKMLHDDFNVGRIAFLGNSFVSDTTYVRRLCERLIAMESSVDWLCTGAAFEHNLNEPGLLPLMRKAGCTSITFGIESGSERIRKILKQPIPLSFYPDIIRLCADNDIKPICCFMFGFPDETTADMYKTIRFGLSLPFYCDVVFSPCLPMPGTACYRETLKQHKLERIDWETYDFDKPRLLPSRVSSATVNSIFLAARLLNKTRSAARRFGLMFRSKPRRCPPKRAV